MLLWLIESLSWKTMINLFFNYSFRNFKIMILYPNHRNLSYLKLHKVIVYKFSGTKAQYSKLCAQYLLLLHKSYHRIFFIKLLILVFVY